MEVPSCCAHPGFAGRAIGLCRSSRRDLRARLPAFVQQPIRFRIWLAERRSSDRLALLSGRAAALQRHAAHRLAAAGRIGPFRLRSEAAEVGVGRRVAEHPVFHLAGRQIAGVTGFRTEILGHPGAPSAGIPGGPPMPGGGLLSETRPGGGAALSGPCLADWAIVARAAGTMLAPSALPKIGLSDWIARNSACCSFDPDSNAMLATSSAGMTAFTCWVAAALLPAPPPGESIGEPPGPPGPPIGDLGTAAAPGASGGGASGEAGSAMAAIDTLV